jgi:ectoine hydroxylase-related dioxygenase (phytanoyl-CoA dioxygenase family)
MESRITEYDRLLPGVPRIESPFFEQIFAELDLDDETRRVAHDLHRDGFAVIDFPDADFEARAEAIKSNLHGRYDWAAWSRNGSGLRLHNAWTSQSDVRALAVNERIINLLSLLYGRRAWPFQTLNFPVGTQQHYHSDATHFNSMPERFMCGVWTALEDIDESCGPLIYYPGSHKWPTIGNDHLGVYVAGLEKLPYQNTYEPLWRALVEQTGIQPKYFTPRNGQALIWAANLLHGGAPQTDRSRTRWSQVTHYFFENCSYYTPLHSNAASDHIAYRKLRDVQSGRFVKNKHLGGTLSNLRLMSAEARNHRGWLRYAYWLLRTRGKGDE